MCMTGSDGGIGKAAAAAAADACMMAASSTGEWHAVKGADRKAGIEEAVTAATKSPRTVAAEAADGAGGGVTPGRQEQQQQRPTPPVERAPGPGADADQVEVTQMQAPAAEEGIRCVMETS
jgi:hypothetical protein